MGQRKILSSHEELNLRPWDSTLQCSTTKPQRFDGEEGPLQSSLMTRTLHTARISNVDGTSNKHIHNTPAQIAHFLLCPQLDDFSGILLTEAIFKTMIVFDVPISGLEFIQSCFEHFDSTFFWHWFLLSPVHLKKILLVKDISFPVTKR